MAIFRNSEFREMLLWNRFSHLHSVDHYKSIIICTGCYPVNYISIMEKGVHKKYYLIEYIIVKTELDSLYNMLS